MSNTKHTPENREIKTAVEQGHFAVIEMRKHAVMEAAFLVALHERSYQTTPAPIHSIVEAELELAPQTPEFQPMQPRIADTMVNVSGRVDAAEEQARQKVVEAYESAA